MQSKRKTQFLEHFKLLGESLANHWGSNNYSSCLEVHELCVPLAELYETLKVLKTEFDFLMLVDICGVDNSVRNGSEESYEVVYHLLNMEEHQRLRVRSQCSLKDEVPSIIDLWDSAAWYEREVWDMFGIDFSSNDVSRLLNDNNFQGHPLRKDFKVGNAGSRSSVSRTANAVESANDGRILNRINIGPVHPVIRGKLKIVADMDDDIVNNVTLDVGYFHRGVEKLAERKRYNQIVPLVERLNPASSFMNEMGYCKAVEELLGLQVNDRVKALRMVFAELARIVDHLNNVTELFADIGVLSEYSFCFEQIEKIRELFEGHCGSRVNLTLNRIGGMVCDLPPIWISDCLDVIKVVLKSVDLIDLHLSKSKFWIDQMKVGRIDARNAIKWGYSGPCLRASGVNYDIRKVSPYYFYDQLDFNVPIGLEGTCYDRYLVRIEEIRQSARIVKQVLNNLPIGNVLVDRESLLEIKPVAGEIYSYTEVANGELGFYLVSDGEDSPYRLKIRTPGFPICQSFSRVVEGMDISNSLITFTSMNIVPQEVDR